MLMNKYENLEMTLFIYSYGKGYNRSGLCRVSGCMIDT